MADKTIGSLPQAAYLTDDSSFVCEDSGEAKRVTGKQFKDFAKEGAAQAAEEAAQSAQEAAESAAVYDDVVSDVNQLKQDLVETVSRLSESIDDIEKYRYSENLVNPKTNLFHSFRIGGSNKNNMQFSKNANDPHYTVLLPVEPNGTYTIFKTDTGLENDYYWFRVIAVVQSVDDIMALEVGQFLNVSNGAWLYGNSTKYVKRTLVTIPSNCNTLIVQVSKNIEPEYIEILKGNFADFMYSSYYESVTLVGTERKDRLYNVGIKKLDNWNINNLEIPGCFYHDSSDGIVVGTPNDTELSTKTFLLLSYHSNNEQTYQELVDLANKLKYYRCKEYSGEKPWGAWHRFKVDGEEITIVRDNSNSFRIKFGKYQIKLNHEVNSSTNSDLWNLVDVTCNNASIIPSGTDILGPIKEIGESDFMGGVHGDETTTSLLITCDGKPYDMATRVTTCDNMRIVMVSKIYRVSTKEHIYNRFVSIEITKNHIKVNNNYVCITNNSIIERATNGGLIAINNNILTKVSMQNYFSDTAPTEKVSNASKCNVEGTLFWENGSITVKNIIGKDYSTYSGWLNVFTNETPIRNKIYFDTISSVSGGTAIGNGESILGAFEYIFS